MAVKRLQILVLSLLLTGVAGLMLAPGAGAASAEALSTLGTGCEQNGLPNSIAILFYGLTKADVPLPGGCFLHVLDFLVVTTTPTNPAGTGTVFFSLPADPNLLGAQLFGQYAVLDPRGALLDLLSVSGGLRVVHSNR